MQDKQEKFKGYADHRLMKRKVVLQFPKLVRSQDKKLAEYSALAGIW